MRVLILGCGYVGTALGLRLAHAGYEVFGARRRPEQLPAVLNPQRVDTVSKSGFANLPADVEHVFYMASADRSDDAAYQRAYVTGLENTFEALQGSGVQRFCFLSSTAVYGQQDGSLVDERSPTDPTNFRGTRMLDAEQLVLQASFEGIIARSAGIYGPGRTRLVDRVRAGNRRIASGSDRFTNRIHRDDLAAALAHLIAMKNPDPVYICSDHEPALKSEVVAWLADRLGIPAVRGTAAPTVRGNKRCSSALLRGTGFTFRYPTYREGYAALLSTAETSP